MSLPFPPLSFSREYAQVKLPGGKVRQLPYPANVSQVIEDLQCEGKTLIAAKVEGAVKNLNFTILYHTATVEPVYLESPDGRSIYRRTISFILMMAASLEFQEKTLVTIEHPTSTNGYMIWLDEKKTRATDEHARQLKERMKEIMKNSYPIKTLKLSRAEALQYFNKRNRPFSQAYLESTNVTDLRCNFCEGYMDLYFRDLASRTDFHPVFDIIAHDGGLVLLFCSSDMNVVDPFVPTPVLDNVYLKTKETARLINVRCVGDLNLMNQDGKSTELLSVCESIHQRRVVACAEAIATKKTAKLVLIAGPSSSGKTTFASKLSIQLRVSGLVPLVLSIDNYYRPIGEVPLGNDGKPDLECPESLRLERINEDLNSLISGKLTETPIYDFHAAAPSSKTLKMQLPDNGVIIMEGIHCLNELLTSTVPAEQKFKIFIAPLTPVILDETNFISNVVNRMARRMIRDYRTRGCSARKTLEMWSQVREGEDKFIFPFVNTAEFVFNTSFEHEMAVLKPHVLPLLRTIKPEDEYFNTANEELWLLNNFLSIQDYHLPPDSLLREFVGHSFFDEAH
jgi:uridine kinase